MKTRTYVFTLPAWSKSRKDVHLLASCDCPKTAQAIAKLSQKVAADGDIVFACKCSTDPRASWIFTAQDDSGMEYHRIY